MFGVKGHLAPPNASRRGVLFSPHCMLAALQIPLTDVRPFLEVDTGRLDKPSWPLAKVGSDFVRSFGIVERRLRGGIIEWPGEELYCNAARALRFNEPVIIFKPPSNPKSHAMRLCAFRRFLADGCAVARYEVGFAFQEQPSLRIGGLRRSQDFIDLSRFVLAQEVYLQLNSGFRQTCSLVDADQYLAQQYLRASTRRNAIDTVQNWWVCPGTPLLIIEYDDWYSVKFPKCVRTVDSQILRHANIELSHLLVNFKGKTIGVWLLGHRFHTLSKGSFAVNRDILRRLRLSLFRIHSERESIRQVFRLIAAKKIQISRRSETSDRLQAYLQRVIKILSKRAYQGLPQSEILDVAYHAEDLVTEGERATLLAELADIRRNVWKNVERFTQPERERPVYHITDNEKVIIIHEPFRRDVVTNQTVNISKSTVGDINQVAAQSIQDSFKKVSESSANDELKNQLIKLNEAVAEMLKVLSPAQQKQVASDLKVLTDEATSEAPRRKWYELNAQGLLEAAKAVGETALPVITAVNTVVGLLTGSK